MEATQIRGKIQLLSSWLSHRLSTRSSECVYEEQNTTKYILAIFMTQVLKIAKFAIYIRLPPTEITKKNQKRLTQSQFPQSFE